MKTRFIKFGEVEIDGMRYSEDVIIAKGKVKLRDKTPSRKHKARFDGHTPLSAKEDIPWKCKLLIIGTGAQGALPIMNKVHQRAKEKGVELVLLPTPVACQLLNGADLSKTNAILHVTC